MSEQKTEQKRDKKKRLIIRQSKVPITQAPRILSGPFGLWQFPIINWLLSISGTFRARQPIPTQLLPKTASRRVEYIRDAQGRIIEKYEEVEIT